MSHVPICCQENSFQLSVVVQEPKCRALNSWFILNKLFREDEDITHFTCEDVI
jgi:hypothetical protein